MGCIFSCPHWVTKHLWVVLLCERLLGVPDREQDLFSSFEMQASNLCEYEMQVLLYSSLICTMYL